MRKVLGIAAVSAIIALAAVFIVPGGKPRVVHAQAKGCDATSLNGAYGYIATGSVYDNQGYIYVLGAAGRLVSDGTGNLTGADTYSLDGTISKRQYTGTYTINADCTGSLTLATSNPGTTHADFTVVDNGKEANLVQSDSAFIFTAVLKQQQTPQTTTPQ